MGFDVDQFIANQVTAIREQVGDGQVLCALSGGVDSSVAAALVHRAVGDQLTCLFVNHGLLRKGEAQQVIDTFEGQFHVRLVYVDAAARFLGRLAGVVDPEEKRKLIGNEFIYLFEEEAAKLGEVGFLVQGTVAADVIESGGEAGEVIKSHHNVGGLPSEMEFELVEPLRTLYKDQVREVGRALGLPEAIVGRHPFPGPGLGIRVLGEVTPEKVAILQEADAIYLDEIRKAGLYDQIWQAFAVLPDVRSVGVSAGQRTYSYPIILRAVNSVDGMSAVSYPLPFELLQRIMQRIIAEVPHVNRVAFDVTSKPPGTIEWE